MKEWLFTYGLLRKKAHHEMSQYLAENAKFVSEATYQGILYLVDDYPGVVSSENPNDQVIGEVFEISTTGILEALDQFEGIGSEFPEPHEYTRKSQEILLEDGQKIEAWIFLYQWEVSHLQRIDSGDFLTYYN